MIERAIAWSTHRRTTVLVAALVLLAGGFLASQRLSRDAIPDLSDPQIVLVADWMGHPAPEVAAVTAALQSQMADIAGVTTVRGASMAGMAYIDVVFGSVSSLPAGRRAIVERVARARLALPREVRIQIGPLASSTGWVFQYALVDRSHGQSPLGLLRLQQDVIRPALAAIPQVAEVASVGGAVEEILVKVDVEALAARRLAFTDVVSTLRSALAAERAPKLAGRDQALEAIPIAAPSGPGGDPAPQSRLGDVAHVRRAYDMATGTVEFGGGLPAVGGIVIAERSARLPALIGAVKHELDRQRSHLPPGVDVVVVYDRLQLANRAERTLLGALGEEIAVVALVILAFLLHARSVLVPVCTLPAVLALTFLGMWVLDIPATIMSLGGVGIALGMAVDADVVALEACHRRLETATLGQPLSPGERRAAIVEASVSFAPAIVTSLIIAALTFMPVLAFPGETGRLLGPLVVTKMLVFGAAAIVALTLGPALRARLLTGRTRREFDNPVTRGLVRAYRPFVHFALTRPVLTLVTAGLAVLSCLPLVPRLGAEFLPRIDEGDLLFMPTTLPGAPPDFVAKHVRQQDRTIAAFPEVAAVLGKAGRADTATDPAPYSMAEVTVRLLPRAEWPLVHQARWYSGRAPRGLRPLLRLAWPEDVPQTTADLVRRLDAATRLPGWTNAWTAPARGRMDMMSTGIRTPVGIRIVAPDADRLAALGAAVRDVAARVPGTRSAVLEAEGGETWLQFVPDAAAMVQANVNPALVRSMADLLLTGGQVGEIARGGRPMRVRVDADLGLRGRLDRFRAVTIRAKGGASAQPVPLALLGRLGYETRPAVVRSDRGERTAYVYLDLDAGTDLAKYVDALSREIAGSRTDGRVRLAAGERLEWAGQYELLQAGQRRLKWIALLVALAMLGLLFWQFKSLVEALLVLASVPFALVGSIWALYLAHYPLSAPVWAGLLSVAGLAMQTGVVLVVYIDDAYKRRFDAGMIRAPQDIVAAHMEGTIQRLRPKIMTITTMGAGLLPLLWAAGAGAEITRRVAVPMIGGLATSAFLTLEVLPVLYTIWRTHQLKRSRPRRPDEMPG